MILTSSQIQQLVEQARREAPNEMCGLIGGQNGRALQIYPLKNVDENPRVRYLADPQELLHAIRDVEETHGWEVVAIYHSHPATPAYPSPTDVARAFYPDAVYILISLMNPALAQVRGFEIKDAKVFEVTLEIEEVKANEKTRADSRRHPKATRGSAPHRAVAALSKGRPGQRKVRSARRRVSK